MEEEGLEKESEWVNEWMYSANYSQPGTWWGEPSTRTQGQLNCSERKRHTHTHFFFLVCDYQDISTALWAFLIKRYPQLSSGSCQRCRHQTCGCIGGWIVLVLCPLQQGMMGTNVGNAVSGTVCRHQSDDALFLPVFSSEKEGEGESHFQLTA